ncbi:MAG TPA: imidazole glycerol phosphate synthase subunit HisH [Paludibacteraceae bacterium]|nr:imidazole glycerol phosphate synthase subunit HisH [Paludibacteraceae bacterium]HPT44108.1 imidazole glycerol phosphate synthase subunit HisH [Paludibacteraceae bacterium]
MKFYHMNVAILKYNAGNIRSVLFALQRLGIEASVTDDHEELMSADKVIFPGVGEASSAMQYLQDKNLDKLIVQLKQPVLGICLGMQLMCSYSEENNTNCLGIFEQQVRKFSDTDFKVPQIGWNNIYNLSSPLFTGINEKEYMYFVHGYYVEKCAQSIATTDYTLEYSAALQKNNFFAVQFHPEKSGNAGQQILQNFLSII